MKKFSLFLCLLVFGALFLNAQPLRLHPMNQRYFEYRGKPVLLVTSAEHYGAVLNREFDYRKYLAALAADGMNYTRIFTGSYVEVPGSFGIDNNTLAPATGQFITPWQRTGEPCTWEGEMKFDLTLWDEAYFLRLKDFMEEAERQGIFVEVTLFCSTYNERSWLRHPFHPGNNVNGLGELQRRETTTLRNPKLVALQKAFVEKMVTELNGYDHFFWELQNEPWADNGVRGMRIMKTHNLTEKSWAQFSELANAESLEWQKEMAGVITETEKNLPNKHLIAQNYCNFKESLADVEDNISILNFHYAWPEVVRMNYGWNRPVGFDESGFTGSGDAEYLLQAWEFMVAGGALFNNLDYSFFVGQEEGYGTNNAPGGGSKKLRDGLRILREFMESFDFIKMAPDMNVVLHAPGVEWQAISEPGRQYALVMSGKGNNQVTFELPRGKYRIEWMDPWTGKIIHRDDFTAGSRPVQIKTPSFDGFAGCRLVRAK